MRFEPIKGAGAGFIYFGFFVLLCSIGIIFLPTSRIALTVTLGVCLLGIGECHHARYRFLLTLTITKKGVIRSCYMSEELIIPWEECEDIGIGRNLNDRFPAYWIFFSKTKLSEKCVRNIRKVDYRESIVLQYRPEVLDEVLKYVDKERVRNLHLLNSK